MSFVRLVRSALALALSFVVVACDSPAPAVDASVPDAISLPDAASPPDAIVTDSLDVTVLHEAVGTLAREPLEGATVGVAQNGVLVGEAVTGADGIARVEIVWADGPIDLTVWAPEHRAQTMLALDERTSQTMAIEWFRPDPTELGHIVGDLTGGTEGTAWVTGSVAPVSSQGGGATSYQIDLARGTPLVLFAFDMSSMTEPGALRNTGYDVAHLAVLEVPALGADDVTVDVDFATDSVSVEEVHAQIVLPGEPGDAIYAESTGMYAVRANLTTSGFLGLSSSCRLTSESSAFDCTMSFARFDHATIDPITRYSLRLPGGVESGVHVRGYPVEGAVIDDMPELPEASADELGSTFTISAPTPGYERIRIFVFGLYGQWIVDAPPGVSTAVLPPVPAAFQAAMDTWEIDTAYVEACYELDAATDWCGRYSSSADIRL